MKIFELQTDLKSYAYPVVKIISCLLVHVLIFMRSSFIHVSSPWIKFIITLLCLALSVAAIVCFYVAIAELLAVAENKQKAKKQPTKTKVFPSDDIVKMAGENDILEIEILSDGKVITIGASSDCKHSSSVFFDKRYYIGEAEYDTLELFKGALTSLFPQGSIPVSSIDGIPPD